jgi:LmbE family N-acetylglucosaminyl deacetylase
MRILLISILLLPGCMSAQESQPDAAAIKQKLNKLNVLTSVLYVAAHPDDENTRVIAYLANERLAATAYLSMTRGDGGQNLIGPEIRDLLGLIRTQELLSARRIDGGQQFFTRANDFGFSKNVNETLEIWNKDEVLSDVVKVIRQFQPDVILTRFPPTERAGHGHHTASAVLAQEAFDISAKADRYPQQVKQFGTWQTKRLFTNTGRWWNETINETTPGVVTLNVGSYNTLLGKSYSEIAAESRTQHKSQGFGSPGRRGDAPEYFELAKGDPASKDILEGVNTTWSRVKGGEAVQALVEKAIASYDFEHPSRSIPGLLAIRKAIDKLQPGIWRTRKLEEVNELIKACAGLYTEVTANQHYVSPGEEVKLAFEIVNRSPANVTLKTISAGALGYDSVANTTVADNKLITFKSTRRLSPQAMYSGPYWLKEDHSQGLFKVPDPNMIGMPQSPAAVFIKLVFEVEGEQLVVNSPLTYKWTDPVKGELLRPFEIVPKVSLTLASTAYIFKDSSPQSVTVNVKAYADGTTAGDAYLNVPKGWKVTPARQPFSLPRRGSETSLVFEVTPTSNEMTASLYAEALVGGVKLGQSLQTITYDHIPVQTLLPKASAKAVRIDLRRNSDVIAYIKGAGDDVPAALRNMGYQVWEMKDEEVTPQNLKKVDAVVLGIRTLNTNERIRYFMPALLDYVQQGGTLVSQYNNNFGLEIDADKFSPYPLAISRDRVTEEDSEVRILKPDHIALNEPNRITAADFGGWVQERGLYYPGKWDPQFDALISGNDKGEQPRDGGLLVARYGKGYYVYTSLSFFRQLPEGVPGAYKIFSNLVSLSKSRLPEEKVKSPNE